MCPGVREETSMDHERKNGRTVGFLLLIQMTGLIVPFVLLHPIAAGPQAFLADAAGASASITTAVFLLFANCALTVGISILMWPMLSRENPAAALWLVALGLIMFCMQAVDNAHILSIVSLSREYAAGGSAEIYGPLAASLGATRVWVHYTELLVIDLWIGFFYFTLLRLRAVPTVLAVFGLLTVLLHLCGIPLPKFLGLPVNMMLGPPMAVAHIATATWLIARGFRKRADDELARSH
jgi:hypothetical protein